MVLTIMLTGRFETMRPIWNGCIVSNFKYVDSLVDIDLK